MTNYVASWSQTAASNSTSDLSVNWAEGQPPSTINNSARAMMASVARWRDDVNGTLTTGGSSTAYTVTTNQGLFASLSALDGVRLAIRLHTTNGASPTLAVDGLSALAIVTSTGVAVPTGALLSGNIYHVTLVNSSSEFRLHDWYDPTAGFGAFAAGTALLFAQAAAPTGWTKSTTFTDHAIRCVAGSGGTSGGSTGFSSVFASRTITQGNLPSYNLTLTSLTCAGTVTVSTRSVPEGTGTSRTLMTTQALQTGTDTTGATFGSGTVGGTLNSGGSGTAMDFAVKYLDTILCTKN